MSEVKKRLCKNCKYYEHQKMKDSGLSGWYYSVGKCTAEHTLHLQPPEWNSCYLHKYGKKKCLKQGG